MATAVLKPKDHRKIREMRNRGCTLKEIADTFGVSYQRIGALVENSGRHNGAARLRADRELMRKAVYGDRTMTVAQVAERYGIGVKYTRIILKSQSAYDYATNTRWCITCGVKKVLTEEFYRIATSPHAYTQNCRDCDKARSRRWVKKNHAEFLAKRRVYTTTAKYKEYRKVWCNEHRAQINAAAKARYRKKKAERENA